MQFPVAACACDVGTIVAAVDTSVVFLAAAAAPPMCWAVLLLRLARHERPWGGAPWAALGGGVLAAVLLALPLNEVVPGWLGARAESAWTPVAVGPLVEEASKAVVLVMVLGAFGRGTRDMPGAIVHGALVGLGFTAAENVDYLEVAALQGGFAGLLRGVYLRGVVEGLNHACFTAAMGAALGYAGAARAWGRRLGALALGAVTAVGQHAAWNAGAANTITEILCGAVAAGGPCRAAPRWRDLFGAVPLVVAAFVGPGIAGLVVLAARAGGRPRGEISGPPVAG